MGVSRSLTLAGICQSILGELPDRLVQAVARRRSGVIGHDERLAYEGVEVSQHVDLVGIVDDGTDARQVEAAGEHRRGAQQRPFVVGQQVVGPLDGVAQRELTLRTRRAALQQAEPVGEPVPDLDRTHRRHAGRGQLDAERQPVDGLADLRHRRRGLRVLELEVAAGRAGPLDEQGDGIGGHAALGRQRRHDGDRLARHADGLARGRQDLRVPGSTEDRLDRSRGRTPEVLAVVDDEQHPPPGDRVGDGVDQRHVALRRDAQHRRERRGHRARVADPGQLDDPDPVVELPRELGTDLDGQAGLADTTDAGQRDQTLRPHQLADLVDLGVAPDEGADLAGEVAGEAVDAAQHGELRAEPVGHHLEHRDRAAQPAQEVVTQGAQGDPTAHQDLGRVGHEHLATVGEGHQPRGSVHLCAVVVPVALNGLAGVQPHSDAERDGVVANQLPLRLDGGRDRVHSRRERGAEAVATRGEHVAPVALDRRADDDVVRLHRLGHVRRDSIPTDASSPRCR